MRIIIVTQEENLYLPGSFARVCRAFPDSVVCIAAAPAMSTHGGPLRGLLRHVQLFGLRGSATLGWRVMTAKVKALVTSPGKAGPFHAIGQVAHAWDIPYHSVGSLKGPEFGPMLDRYRPDLLVSIRCPQIIGKSIRDRPMGSINVHRGPLPRYRGLLPAFWALRTAKPQRP